MGEINNKITGKRKIGKVIKWSFIIFVGVILIYLCTWCYQNIYMVYCYQSPQEKYFYSELDKNIRNGKTEVYLKDLTNFKWDKAYFLGPYLGAYILDSIYDEKVDKTTANIRKYLNADGRWALAFIDEKKRIYIKGNRLGFNRQWKFKQEYDRKAKMVIDDSKFIIIE